MSPNNLRKLSIKEHVTYAFISVKKHVHLGHIQIIRNAKLIDFDLTYLTLRNAFEQEKVESYNCFCKKKMNKNSGVESPRSLYSKLKGYITRPKAIIVKT